MTATGRFGGRARRPRWRRGQARPWARLAVAVVVVALAVSSVAVVGVAWLGLGDPDAALPRATAPAVAVGSEAAVRGAREIRHVRLEVPSVGTARLFVSLPAARAGSALPVAVVLGGLGTGEEIVGHIDAPGRNAVVGMDWPIPKRLPDGWALAAEGVEIRRRLLAFPAMAAAAIEWAAAQPWADAERISLLGFSLGALAAPAIQRLAAERGVRIGWTVLAYGGVDLGTLAADHPKVRGAWWRPVVETAIDLTFAPIEPARHLTLLSGRFLVVAGEEDTLIPRASAEGLRRLTPEPKSVVRLPGRHIGTGRDEAALRARVIALTRRWLVDEGAVRAR